uniref:Uncharacterized protein n=1 Tax=Nelumbo nucifera TaxID=4432 RepID=A0A822Y9S6_NELNU|nr:TPA_asm: hypothetical protein HUJ06_030321 [Nelumbo nucifera]
MIARKSAKRTPVKSDSCCETQHIIIIFIVTSTRNEQPEPEFPSASFPLQAILEAERS